MDEKEAGRCTEMPKLSRRQFLRLSGSTPLLVFGFNFVDGTLFLDEAEASSLAVDRWVPSVCPMCAAGCAILLGVKDGQIVAARGDPEAWNRGTTCEKGIWLAELWQPHATKARLLKPMIRDRRFRGTYDGFREVSWDEALQFVAERMAEFTRERVGDRTAFALYGSGSVSTEFEFLQGKLGVVGMNLHADTNGRLCQPTMVMGMVITFGIDGPPMTIRDVFHADNVLLWGFNVGETTPRWFAEIARAKHQRGPALKIAIVDPVRISACSVLDEKTGDMWVPVFPGTDILLINAVAHVIVYELEGINERFKGSVEQWLEAVQQGTVRPRYLDLDFIQRYTNFFRCDYKVLGRLVREGGAIFKEIAVGLGLDGFKAYAQFLAKFKPEEVAPRVGVSAEQIRQLARLFVRGRNTMSMYLQGFGQQANGVAKHLALVTLHAITGRLGRAGSGVMPVIGQCNGLGQRIGGAVVGRLPGNLNHPLPAHRRALAKALARGNPEIEALILERLEDPEKSTSRLGFTAVDMFRQIAAGAIKGVWIVCTNPMVSFPNLNETMKALQKAELVVVQDIFQTETSAFADVLFPAAAISGESVGTFANAERRFQILEKAAEPPGDALPDDIIFLALAFRYARVLEAQGRTQEARLLNFLMEPFVSGYEELFAKVQPNVKRLREVAPQIAERIFAELASVSKGSPSNDFSGLSYQRLRTDRDWNGFKGFQIPVPSPEHKGTERLYDEAYEAAYKTRFATPDGRVRCFLVDEIPPAEQPSTEYPFIAVLPRLYEHFHTRTRTGRFREAHHRSPQAWVSFNPKDAEKLGIKDGDLVEVSNARGRLILKARIDREKPPREGVVWIPWHFGFLGDLMEGKPEPPPGTQAGNILSTEVYDLISRQPHVKAAAVTIRKVEPRA